ncbi:MAG: bacillithiol system redox-active protein YtxJ [Bacteroidia bacterium]|nr:bacillithiol system redox-active protein YtxJ [Bacteroidia bacterium]
MANWSFLNREDQLAAILRASHERPQLIFKHSTQCGTSAMVFDMLEGAVPELVAVADLYYLDLLAYRPVSNQVAQELNIPHQSPQVIMIQGGVPVYHASHMAIHPRKLIESVRS